MTQYHYNQNELQGMVYEDDGHDTAVTYKPEDARRIAACLNACDGIDTNALENDALPRLFGAVRDMLFALDPEKLHAMADAAGYTVELFDLCREAVRAAMLDMPEPEADPVTLHAAAYTWTCPKCGTENEAHDPRERVTCGQCEKVFTVDAAVHVGK